MMNRIKIKINGKIYDAKEGETVLDVCRREKIRIPTLCSCKNLLSEAVCRLCLVKIENQLVPSCATKVFSGMEVITEDEEIKKSREINLELLWSDHAGKCFKCPKNRRCELQDLAEEYKIENFNFVPRREELSEKEEIKLIKENKLRVVVDEKNPAIKRTTEYCVECRRCINVCPVKSYGFNYRAGDVVVGTPYQKTLDCLFCGQCVAHCPTGALTDQNDLEKIEKKLDDLKIMAVAIVDPAIFESLNNEFPEVKNSFDLVEILKRIGFEKVFNLKYGNNLYVKRLIGELKRKKQKEIIFNGNCIAFERLIKKYYPQFEKNLSQTEIPDEILASNIKKDYAERNKINEQDIFVVSLSPCVAKKSKNYENLDAVLTVREIGRLFRNRKIEIDKTEKKIASGFDLLSEGENIYADISLEEPGGTKKAIFSKIEMKKYKKVSCCGIKDIKKKLDEISRGDERYDFFEGLICPGGCLNGGGQAMNLKD